MNRVSETIHCLNTAVRALDDIDDALSYVVGYDLIDVSPAQIMTRDLLEEISRLTIAVQAMTQA